MMAGAFHILIVADSAEQADLWAKPLREAGHHVALCRQRDEDPARLFQEDSRADLLLYCGKREGEMEVELHARPGSPLERAPLFQKGEKDSAGKGRLSLHPGELVSQLTGWRHKSNNGAGRTSLGHLAERSFVVVLNTEGIVQFCNSSYRELYPQLGRGEGRYLDLLHPQDRRTLQEILCRIEPDQTERLSYRIRTPQGEWLRLISECERVGEQGSSPQILISSRGWENEEGQLKAALYRIAEITSQAEEMQEFYRQVHGVIEELMYARNLYLALYDAASGIVSFPYFVDEVEPQPEPRRMRRGLTEYVLHTGEPLLAPEEKVYELASQGKIELLGAPCVDWLGVPLKHGGRTIGALVVQSYTPDIRFGQLEKQLLTFVSQHVATALERKRAQQALRASEERYRRLVEISPDGILIHHRGQIVFINRAGAEMLGAVSPEEIIGRPVVSFVHQDSREVARFQAQEIRRSQQATPFLEQKLVRLDGGIVEVEAAATSFSYRGQPAVQVVLRDITSRKRAERALVASERRYRLLFERNLAGFFRCTPDGRFLECNEAFARIFSFADRQQVLETPAAAFFFEARDWDEYARRLEENGILTNTEIHLKRRDGRPVWILANLSLVQEEEVGTVIEGTLIDISDLKQLEEQLRQSQKMEAVGRLAGGIAHDFNNLLTAIIGYGELLLEQMPAESPMYHEVTEIRKAAERARSLTSQLLAFSRKQILAPRVIDLNQVITNIRDMLCRVIGENIRLQVELDPHTGLVKVDPAQIEQVIVNLAINARDAMPEGGVLRLATSPCSLEPGASRSGVPLQPGRYVKLTCSDSGCGIDEETRERIFEPFFTTKEEGKGTGLGLATVYGIVKQSGGYIFVESEVGKGTTFEIYLPRADHPNQERPVRAEVVATPKGSETVLVVEDQPGIRELMAGILKSRGYRVLTAPDADTVLAGKLDLREVHLLLSDVVMPGTSGPDLARRLLQDHPRLKVLFISGYTEAKIIRHGVLEGVTAFLQKPFTPSDLLLKVREVLDADQVATPR